MNRKEPQPHRFGAFPYQYRTGASAASAEQPPSWSPELVHDRAHPYALRECRRDVSRWQGAAKVTVQHQGPLVALAIGGAARVIVDQIDDLAWPSEMALWPIFRTVAETWTTPESNWSFEL